MMKALLHCLACGCLASMLGGCLAHRMSSGNDKLRLNDVHSRLNPTHVQEIITPRSSQDVVDVVKRARAEGRAISISGARHSMGGQQFANDALHLDMRGMNRFLTLDPVKKLARAEAGITWPQLLAALEDRQKEAGAGFLTFRQKQTGADELTLGGAVSANIHGRGLDWKPFVGDIESLTLVDAQARVRKVSRTENEELFPLVVGGYGLFGVITEVELRLVPRQRVERVVEISSIKNVAQRIEQRKQDGFLLGDFQFCPDEKSPGFLQEGVFACYRPVAAPTPEADAALKLSPDAWRKLIIQAHADKPGAWAAYKAYYQRTQGQHYWHDRAQMNHYDTDYEERIELALPSLPKGSLMITELYVPRARLADFMAACADDMRRHSTQAIYGTVRFIERDNETFLPWARHDYACIVVNLRVTHGAAGLEAAQAAFRRLIDRALERDGSFFLTYHRWATREQMLRAYPQFPKFLHLKKQHDPREVFRSEWYRHWRAVFSN